MHYSINSTEREKKTFHIEKTKMEFLAHIIYKNKF